jgi:hypothetical protein
MIAASFASNSTSLGDLLMALPERAYLRNAAASELASDTSK